MVQAESGVEGKVSSVVEKGMAVLHQVLPGKCFMGLSTVGAEQQPQCMEMVGRGVRCEQRSSVLPSCS